MKKLSSLKKMSEEKRTGLAIYRESPIDVFLDGIQPENTADFAKYLKEKISYLSFVRGNDFETRLIDSGLNPNDKECLELVLQRLTGVNAGSSSELCAANNELSVAKGVIELANSIYGKLIHFMNAVQVIYDAYAYSGITMEFNNIVLISNPGNNYYGPNKIILEKLNPKKLLIRQQCFDDNRHPSVLTHGVLDIKVGIAFDGVRIFKGKSCTHVGYSMLWRNFHKVAKKYADFYAQRSLGGGDEFSRLEAYLNDYLEIPTILADKLGITI